MIGKLNYLGKHSFIAIEEEWLRISDVRNKFAHDYPDDAGKNAQYLNLAFETALRLYGILATPAANLAREHPEPSPGMPYPANQISWIRG